MTTKNKKETIEEFLARGGEIKRFPPGPRETDSAVLRPKTQLDYDNMSLGDAEFYFGESRSKKVKPKVTNNDLSKMLNDVDLPQSVIDSLKSKIKKDE